jgi:acetyltransferase-like isoleucine patch superfamily enzyme
MLEIGDGAVINWRAYFMGHTVERRVVRMRNVVVGERATIGALCGLLPESSVGEGAVVGDCSVVMKVGQGGR